MKVVVDANRVFSAVITKGKGLQSRTLDVFFSDKAEFFAPYRLLAEIENNRRRIISASGFSHEDLDVFVSILKFRIEFVPLENFIDNIPEARIICPDPKDIEFFGLALKLDAALWSDEKVLKKQDKLRVLRTSELAKELGLTEKCP